MELNIPPKYRKDIENATNLLKNEGCKSIFLFGSLVTGRMHDNSDIDIGIRGLPKGKFLDVYFPCARFKTTAFRRSAFSLIISWKDDIIQER